MQLPPLIKLALLCYDLLLAAAIPLLRFNHNLKEGYDARRLRGKELPSADIWMQAASVGEAYLAREILMQLNPENPLTVLVTTNIKAGLEVLLATKPELAARSGNLINLHATYFPFDRPSLMRRAVRMVKPRLLVLLETELWPGLLAVCKNDKVRVLLVNGRIKPRSLEKYRKWPNLWRTLAPDLILAISDGDLERFAALFGANRVLRMNNIKFDRLTGDVSQVPDNHLAAIVENPERLVIIGSARRQEEGALCRVLASLLAEQPDLIVAIFPRHLKRIPHWLRKLSRAGLPWQLRSQTTPPVPKGTILIWDTYGELGLAYGLGHTAFIGGSLAPLGGQNLLEPLDRGVVPITGPDWSDFHWLGQEIIDEGLLVEVKGEEALCKAIIQSLSRPLDRQAVREKTLRYVKNRQGGARQAGLQVMAMLLQDHGGRREDEHS